MLLIALIIVAAVVLAILAFIAPRWSRKPQAGVDRLLERGEGKTSQAPGPAGKAMPKPFEASHKIADKSADAGRKAREKT